MAEPGVLSGLGMAAGVGGGALSAFGAISGGNAQAAASSYQAQVARINAQVARINRDQTLDAGAVKAENAGIGARQVAGRIITAQGASGLDINGASATAVRDSQALAATRDQKSIYDNTARAAYGFEVEAANKEASAKMYDASAKSQKTAGIMKGLATILGTASTVSGRWLDAAKNGTFGGSPTASSWSSFGFGED